LSPWQNPKARGEKKAPVVSGERGGEVGGNVQEGRGGCRLLGAQEKNLKVGKAGCGSCWGGDF